MFLFLRCARHKVTLMRQVLWPHIVLRRVVFGEKSLQSQESRVRVQIEELLRGVVSHDPVLQCVL